jgi:hypothetical protein
VGGDRNGYTTWKVEVQGKEVEVVHPNNCATKFNISLDGPLNPPQSASYTSSPSVSLSGTTLPTHCTMASKTVSFFMIIWAQNRALD